MERRHTWWVWAAAGVIVTSGAARAGDWPQLLGPGRNGVAVGEKLARQWPTGGPRVVWKMKVGSGWAGPVVSGGTLVLFHRVDADDVIEALDAATGDKRWTYSYPANYTDDFGFDPGPRATPTIDTSGGGRVYTHGAQGMIHCLDLATGKLIWSVDTVKQFGSPKGYFGRAAAPLIEGDKLVLNIGSPGSGVVALNKATGELIWKAGNDEAGYSSPTAATIDGRRYILVLTRAGLVGLDPATGKAYFNKPWRSRSDASVNAAVPIVTADTIFISSSYNTGATLLKVTPDGLKTLWANDTSLSNHYTTSVQHGGFLYGFHGRQEEGAELHCVNLNTGEVKWTADTHGAGWIIVAGDDLLIVTEKGELILAPASPKAFAPAARAQVLGFDARACPALCHGLLYARDKRQLICVDLATH